ncbi:hypothetical protein QBC35DRAFT_385591 [Podospora australis]|uniref:SnoaL-like domain-containing protein n=1 Tax=Podospora australis TaxID=1536484 RepID=A0AAN6WSF3_9PEZI|nr:hypothetical protein QBC35DRAFT_385591 [Podospora australis]
MSLREQIAKTARAWLKAHRDRNPDAIRALVAPDFIANFHPKSLPPQGNKDGEGYVQFSAQAFTLFETYSPTEVDLVVDEGPRKAVCYVEARGYKELTIGCGTGTAAAPGVNDGYSNQYIHKLTLTEDGRLVKVFDSFVDSAAMMVFMGKVFAAKSGVSQPSE